MLIERIDFIAVPAEDRERAARFYEGALGARLEAAGVEFLGETWDSGVCNGAVFKDSEGNGLVLHRRYAPYRDGTQP